MRKLYENFEEVLKNYENVVTYFQENFEKTRQF